MSELSKISYYDLRLEKQVHRLPRVVGFSNEISRLTRVLSRQLQHNAIICAPSGSGKTALLYGWAHSAANLPVFANKKIVLLYAPTLQKIGQLAQNSLNFYQDAFAGIHNSVLIIDSFGEMIYQNPTALQNWNMLLKPLFFKDDINVVLTMQPEEKIWLEENKSHFFSHFEILKLDDLSDESHLAIVKAAAAKLGERLKVQEGVFELILSLCKRFPKLGQVPKSTLSLLDEAIAECKLKNGATIVVTKSDLEKIAAEKTGVPLERLNSDDKAILKNLPQILQSKIVGQSPAISKVVSIIQRAKLGLRSQNRPLGSFLVLGPSGVGKTETAKTLAETLYGSQKNFLRLDMSEFGQEHSTARLLGSPAGYVGYGEGGQLTNQLKEFPYSLVLLDEIEKAHPKTFDIFLQLLDDGRLTSGQGETVDATQSIVMATSNIGVQEIVHGFTEGADIHQPEFTKQRLMPVLVKHFRLEFLNRFDAILVYNPLTTEHLADIALMEIKKIEQRVSAHNIRFSISREQLLEQVATLADPRFGARPVKRFIEDTCENLITQQLLK